MPRPFTPRQDGTVTERVLNFWFDEQLAQVEKMFYAPVRTHAHFMKLADCLEAVRVEMQTIFQLSAELFVDFDAFSPLREFEVGIDLVILEGAQRMGATGVYARYPVKVRIYVSPYARNEADEMREMQERAAGLDLGWIRRPTEEEER